MKSVAFVFSFETYTSPCSQRPISTISLEFLCISLFHTLHPPSHQLCIIYAYDLSNCYHIAGNFHWCKNWKSHSITLSLITLLHECVLKHNFMLRITSRSVVTGKDLHPLTFNPRSQVSFEMTHTLTAKLWVGQVTENKVLLCSG